MADVPLSRNQILRLLDALADELPDGPQHEIVVAGGSVLALHGLRATTLDVDCVRTLDTELQAAAFRVAQAYDLADDWLNSRAAPYLPQTWERADCEVLLDRPALRVLGLALGDIFLMKLHAARRVGIDDLKRLWPRCSFASPSDAIDRFYAAYPNESFDEHLESWIQSAIVGAK
ncbi:MAG: DUF6036 family nucleotidyltransferase [Acidimicrobiia bacterium]